MQARLAVTLRGIILTGCGGDGSTNGRFAAQGADGNLYALSFARGDVQRVVFQ